LLLLVLPFVLLFLLYFFPLLFIRRRLYTIEYLKVIPKRNVLMREYEYLTQMFCFEAEL
jgi:hypothetical protein